MGRQYVAISEIAVPEAGVGALVAAFRGRLGAVDRCAGFRGLEVLQSRRHPGEFLMITRWVSREDFLAYMRSEDHRASHARIPAGANAPHAMGFADYQQVAE